MVLNSGTLLRFVVGAISVATALHYCLTASNSLDGSNSPTFAYKFTSDILYANFTALAASNETICVGDSSGFINLFVYDSKKDTITFKTTTRPSTPSLNFNPVRQVQLLGNSTMFHVNENSFFFVWQFKNDFTPNYSRAIDIPCSSFEVINKTHMLVVSKDQKTLCLYTTDNFLLPTGEIKQVTCNRTSSNYRTVKYSPNSQLIATGTNKSVIILQLREDQSMRFLLEVNLLKSEEDILALEWTSIDVLLADNGLWLHSIVFDSNFTSGKVLSSQRIEKSLGKGESDDISLFEEPKSTGVILTNGHQRGIVYDLNSQDKLTFRNDSKEMDRINNPKLISATKFLSNQGYYVQLVEIGASTSDQKYFRILKAAPIESSNHYAPVRALAFYEDYAVSVSEGSVNNFKVWRLNSADNLRLEDSKTFTFFSILKSGYTSLFTLLMIPPKQSLRSLKTVQAKNETLHVLAAGNDPFQLILVILAPTTGKISEVVKSTAEHSNNITFLALSKDQAFVFSGSKDSSIITWTLAPDHKSLNKSLVTATKNGPISFGLMDSTKTYMIVGHDGSQTSLLANITLWKIEDKTGKLAKLAQNVPGQAHEANMTGFVFSKDEKFLITMSQKGELKLWRHQSWTMVDLLASLSVGVLDAVLILTESGKLVIQGKDSFLIYDFDQNGFIFNSKTVKPFKTNPVSLGFYKGKVLFQGSTDGAITSWSYSQ